MADNFSAFDYKTQEEVFIVIKAITAYLSTTGMLILEGVSPKHLLSHIRTAVRSVFPHLYDTLLTADSGCNGRRPTSRQETTRGKTAAAQEYGRRRHRHALEVVPQTTLLSV